MAKNQNIKPLTYLSLILIIITLLTSLYHPPTAWFQDLGRHLKLGQIILQTKSVPQTNLFSYTRPDYPFTNHHWLSEVIFYLTYQNTGNLGLGLVKILTLTLAFILALIQTQKSAPLTTVLPLAALTLPIYLERTHIRPEIFSLLLFAFLLFLLSKPLTNKALITIPLILVLWANLHIYFAVGLIALYFYALDKQLNQKQTLPLYLALVSTLACLINPNGLTGLIAPFNILKDYGYSIIENQSPFFLDNNFTNLSILYFKLSLPLTLLGLVLSLQKKRLFPFLLLSFLTLLSFQQIRTFPLYALALIIFLPPLFHSALRTFFSRHPRLTLALVLISFYPPLSVLQPRLLPQTLKQQVSRLPFTLKPDPYLHSAFQFIKDRHLKGPIFNNFDLGGLTIYHLYPQELTFVDNRPEAFPASFFHDVYLPMQQNPGYFNSLNQLYKFNLIIFAHSDLTPWGQTFLQNIIHHPNFTLVYFDPYHLVMANNTAYPQLTSSPITDQNALTYLSPHLKTYTTNHLARLQRFTSLINWNQSGQYFTHKLKSQLLP